MSVLVTCNQCGASYTAQAGHVNRAKKIGANLYCGRACAGLAHRRKVELTEAQKKEAKRLYDQAYRAARAAELKAKKRAAYMANREVNHVKAKIWRSQNMHKHVAYCRRPEYREYKAEYDRRHLAKKHYGTFAEVALMLRQVEQTIAEKSSYNERHAMNGNINKAQTRRRAL